MVFILVYWGSLEVERERISHFMELMNFSTCSIDGDIPGSLERVFSSLIVICGFL